VIHADDYSISRQLLWPDSNIAATPSRHLLTRVRKRSKQTVQAVSEEDSKERRQEKLGKGTLRSTGGTENATSETEPALGQQILNLDHGPNLYTLHVIKVDLCVSASRRRISSTPLSFRAACHKITIPNR